jgi:subtilase family serine protease
MHMGGCPGDVQKTAPCLNPKNQNNPGDDSFDYAGHDGLFYGVIGTSASAPEFAGLLAVVEQSIGGKRLGNVNTLLYAYAKPPYVHQGIPATDGVPGYSVAKGKLGYNVITGLGTPDLIPFLELLTKKSLVPAGNPQTKGNP